MTRKKAKIKARKTSKSSHPAQKKARKAKNAGRRRGSKRTRGKILVKGRPSEGTLVAYEQRGLGARSGGQAGDTQGLSAAPDGDSESVEELMEEGQSFEAEVLEGIERVPDPDEEEVRTKEVPEDDVPEEYREGETK